MRFVKLAIISSIGLFAVLTGISLLLPSQVRISRAVDITAPKEKLLTRIYYVTTWRQWNKFIDSIPYSKLDNDVLENETLAIAITQRSDNLVTAGWQQKNGRYFNSGFVLIPQANNQFTLQWYFDFKLRWYPWEKFQSIVYDQQLGPVMETSLKQLKDEVER
jgi:hypothetical protein